MGNGDLTGICFDGHTRCLNTDIVFEHEIRRRPTDRREVITRMTRIFYFAHGSHGLHGSCSRRGRSLGAWTRDFFEHELNESNEYFFWHTDLTDHTDLSCDSSSFLFPTAVSLCACRRSNEEYSGCESRGAMGWQQESALTSFTK